MSKNDAGDLPAVNLPLEVMPFCVRMQHAQFEFDASQLPRLAGELAGRRLAVTIDGSIVPRQILPEYAGKPMLSLRVQGMVAGQTLAINNSDRTLHNVHTYRGASTVFNKAQVAGAGDIEHKLTDAGAMLKLRCDVHQWMVGYVWVQNNGHFAVTGDEGSFEIGNVPVGTYDIEAWHERFGVKAGKVTIAKNSAVEIQFEYVATDVVAK